MFDKELIRIRNAPLMDLAVYLTLIIFVGTALVVVPDIAERAMISILLIVFGLAYTFGYRIAATPQYVNAYLAVQTLITAVLLLRFPAADVFSFLLFILVIQVTIALPPQIAARWVLLFFVIESLRLFGSWSGERVVNILLLAPVYFLTSVFGYSLRQAEIARRQNQKLFEELKATQLQLQDLAVAEERTRLAREMHDSLGHQLTVAIVQLEGAQRLIPTRPEQAIEMIRAMRDELKNALADLRRTVTALRSPIADDLPLESALLALCHTFERNTGLATHFTAASYLPEMPEPYGLAFYRTAQEGLTNIQRHTNAKNAWINLSADEAHITLTILDDGKGSGQRDEKNSGVGLIGLGERASQLGGEMRFTSKPETGGSTLTMILPLADQRKVQ